MHLISLLPIPLLSLSLCSSKPRLYPPLPGSLSSSLSIYFKPPAVSQLIGGPLVTAFAPNAAGISSRCAALNRRTRHLLMVTGSFLCVLSCPVQGNGVQTFFLLAKDLIFLLAAISCALSCLPPSF